MRRRLTSTVSEVLTKSKSSNNLRRSSSTTSGSSSGMMKNYDSAFESLSMVSERSFGIYYELVAMYEWGIGLNHIRGVVQRVTQLTTAQTLKFEPQLESFNFKTNVC